MGIFPRQANRSERAVGLGRPRQQNDRASAWSNSRVGTDVEWPARYGPHAHSTRAVPPGRFIPAAGYLSAGAMERAAQGPSTAMRVLAAFPIDPSPLFPRSLWPTV